MPISGLIAAGAHEALQDVLQRRMQEIVRRQQESQHQDQLRLQEEGLNLQRQNAAGVAEDRAANRADQAMQRVLQTKQFDLADLTRREAINKQHLERAAGGDMSNVLNLPGMTPEQQRKEIAGIALRTGLEPPKGVIDLLQINPKLRSVTVPGPGGKPFNKMVPETESVEEYVKPTPPTAGEREPLFVEMPDHTIKDLHGIAPPGARPALSASAQQTANDKAAVQERARVEMQAYGDDMLSVINEMIDEKGSLKPHVKAVVGGVQGRVPDWLMPTMEYSDANKNKYTTQGALASIDRLQGMLDINKINDMKNQSRTGATGFGALSAPELAIIENSASKLRNRKVSDPEYAAELVRLRNVMLRRQAAGAPGGSADVDHELQLLLDRQKKPK